jgi:hypothetical protein
MTILMTSIIAAIVGIILFWFVVPHTAVWLTKVVENSARMDRFQKLRIINVLETASSGPSENRVNKGTWFLSITFLALLGLQHYFLFTGNGGGAQIVVIGMFAMLAVHVGCD